jgi:hypothetical protein
MWERREVVLQTSELLKPIAPNKIGTGGKSLTKFDKTRTKASEGVENASSQTSLNVSIGTRTTQQKNDDQTAQRPKHLNQPRYRNPWPKEQPPKVTPGVVLHIAAKYRVRL